eukprot:6210248-Pleurochrysis_carterae.AAC.5
MHTHAIAKRISLIGIYFGHLRSARLVDYGYIISQLVGCASLAMQHIAFLAFATQTPNSDRYVLACITIHMGCHTCSAILAKYCKRAIARLMRAAKRSMS